MSARCLGLVNAFVEIDGPINAWAIDRNSDGFTVWVGRVNVNFSWTVCHLRLAKLVALGFAVDFSFHLAGCQHWGPAQPLEYMTWAAMAKRYIV